MVTVGYLGTTAFTIHDSLAYGIAGAVMIGMFSLGYLVMRK